MAIFKISDCDVGFSVNGVNYDLEYDSCLLDDPQRKSLVRGANASNLTGLVFTEGMKNPKVMTIQAFNVSAAIFALAKGLYDAETRVEAYAIDRKTGSSRTMRKALLTKPPRQLSIAEGPDSLNVEFIFESFELIEKHKE
jgi:hypothetical protein